HIRQLGVRCMHTSTTTLQSRPAKRKSIKWEAECIEIIQETPDVRTFRFEKPEDWTFVPGQYLMVFFPEVFGKKNRAYSIASSPNSDYIDLTIKLYGLFTHHMWTLTEGSTWTLRGPYGHFILNTERKNDVLLLGAGVGVTPLMSMIRWATEVKSDRRFLLLYSNKKPKDIIFHNELQAIERMNPNVKIVYTLTRLEDRLKQSWPGLTGRINGEMVKSQVMEWQNNDGETPTSLTCGPIVMIETVEKVLTELGWPKEEIQYEKFW
ncbi:MAG: FAD-binding oxidoreductase, partial [Candidatus Heimdallarchaeota archaeon]|nr:FAD-binding oxidoreductase [Candidatus Heimdallarchaeota archaeon]